MRIPLAIVWDIDPEIFNLFGVSIRYYGLLFVGGLILGYQVAKPIFLREGFNLELLEKLVFYIFLGTIIGARLGHCLFYEPGYYLSNPLEMILPIQFTDGGFEFTGFTGLASHGGILGVFIAIYIFCRKFEVPFYSVLDKVAIGGSLTAVFIRMANLMNSEILGKATGTDYGFIFTRVDTVVRHPAQLYEAGAYFIIFLVLYYFYKNKRNTVGSGFTFGLFFTLLFISRFFLEYFKENQVGFEDAMTFNMGQLLSIPFIILGLIVMVVKRNP